MTSGGLTATVPPKRDLVGVSHALAITGSFSSFSYTLPRHPAHVIPHLLAHLRACRRQSASYSALNARVGQSLSLCSVRFARSIIIPTTLTLLLAGRSTPQSTVHAPKKVGAETKASWTPDRGRRGILHPAPKHVSCPMRLPLWPARRMRGRQKRPRETTNTG